MYKIKSNNNFENYLVLNAKNQIIDINKIDQLQVKAKESGYRKITQPRIFSFLKILPFMLSGLALLILIGNTFVILSTESAIDINNDLTEIDQVLLIEKNQNQTYLQLDQELQNLESL